MTKKYRITRKAFPQFSFYGNNEYYVHVVTDIMKELFGKDIVKYAWLVFDEVNCYPSERPEWEIELPKLYETWEKSKTFYFDTNDVVIEFKNGNMIRTVSSEWGYFSKGNVNK